MAGHPLLHPGRHTSSVGKAIGQHQKEANACTTKRLACRAKAFDNETSVVVYVTGFVAEATAVAAKASGLVLKAGGFVVKAEGFVTQVRGFAFDATGLVAEAKGFGGLPALIVSLFSALFLLAKHPACPWFVVYEPINLVSN